MTSFSIVIIHSNTAKRPSTDPPNTVFARPAPSCHLMWHCYSHYTRYYEVRELPSHHFEYCNVSDDCLWSKLNSRILTGMYFDYIPEQMVRTGSWGNPIGNFHVIWILFGFSMFRHFFSLFDHYVVRERQPLYCFHFDFQYVTLVRYIYIYIYTQYKF